MSTVTLHSSKWLPSQSDQWWYFKTEIRFEINGKVSAHSQLSHYRLHPIYICRLPKVEVTYTTLISKPKYVLKSAQEIYSENPNFKLIRQIWRKLILAYIQACRRYILHSPATYRVKLVMSSWRNTEAPNYNPSCNTGGEYLQ